MGTQEESKLPSQQSIKEAEHSLTYSIHFAYRRVESCRLPICAWLKKNLLGFALSSYFTKRISRTNKDEKDTEIQILYPLSYIVEFSYLIQNDCKAGMNSDNFWRHPLLWL